MRDASPEEQSLGTERGHSELTSEQTASVTPRVKVGLNGAGRSPRGKFARKSVRSATEKRRESGQTMGQVTTTKTPKGAKGGRGLGVEDELHRPSVRRPEVEDGTTLLVGSRRNATFTNRRGSLPGSPTIAQPLKEHTRIRRKIRLQGFGALDKRMPAVRAIQRWKQKVIADAGGLGALSLAGATLIELTARSLVILEHYDYHLFAQTSMVRGKGKSLKAVPLAHDRNKLTEAISRQLSQLGLTRQTKTIPALAQYVNERYAKGSAEPADPVQD
jgi:hypothetical protein